MGYIAKHLLQDETILFFTRKHKIIFFYPIVLTLIAVNSYGYMVSNPILVKLAAVPFLIAAILWIYSGIEYVMSEYAVTNRRLLLREGFITRHVSELRLDAVAQVNVEQSLLGQLLGYGTIFINAFGAADVFTLIAGAEKFQRQINEQIMRKQ